MKKWFCKECGNNKFIVDLYRSTDTGIVITAEYPFENIFTYFNDGERKFTYTCNNCWTSATNIALIADYK